MKTLTAIKTSLTMAAVLMLPAAYANTLSKADYSAGKTRISANYKADKTACAALAGNTKDVCIEETKAKEKVALAELTFSYTGKPADETKVLETRAESSYAVAKEKCDDLAGNAKDVCIKEAKAVKIRALVNARMARKISDTRQAGAQDKLDADYKVAAEKCEAFAGDAKASCVLSAKVQFGKN